MIPLSKITNYKEEAMTVNRVDSSLWEQLNDHGLLNSSGEIIIDPNMVDELQAEFEEFDVSGDEIEEAVEQAMPLPHTTIYVADYGSYDEIKRALRDKYGDKSEDMSLNEQLEAGEKALDDYGEAFSELSKK